MFARVRPRRAQLPHAERRRADRRGAFPVDFKLKTQTSRDIEGGVRGRYGSAGVQSSVYEMLLKNEIFFIPFPPIVANINLDPTRRYGVETSATLRLIDAVRLKGGLAYTRAIFREGLYAGNDVPLVSRWTGNAGLSWNVYEKFVVFDAVVRYVGARRMDNDQANFQPLIPAHTMVDVRLGGEIENFFWSVVGAEPVRRAVLRLRRGKFGRRLAPTTPIRCPDAPSW